MAGEGQLGTGAGMLTVVEGGGLKVQRGTHTTVAASDTIVTKLRTVLVVIVTPQSDPVAGAQGYTATVGDQAGTPAAGRFLLKTWKATGAGDTGLVAGTTFGKLVNWIAIGT